MIEGEVDFGHELLSTSGKLCNTNSSCATGNATQEEQARSLDLDFTIRALLRLPVASLRLRTHDATAPVTPRLLALVHEALLDGGHELRELRLVLGADFGDGERGGGLGSALVMDM